MSTVFKLDRGDKRSEFRQVKKVQTLLVGFMRDEGMSRSMQRDYLQFVIRALKTDIIKSAMSRLLFKSLKFSYKDDSAIASSFLPAPWAYKILGIEDKAETKEPFFCESSAYMAWPAEVHKLVPAISDIEREGFQQQKNYTDGLHFPELNFTIVRNGRHHATAAMQREGITLNNVDVYPLAPLFPYLDTDGAIWRIGENTQDVLDPRFAIMYALARLVYKLDATGSLE